MLICGFEVEHHIEGYKFTFEGVFYMYFLGVFLCINQVMNELEVEISVVNKFVSLAVVEMAIMAMLVKALAIKPSSQITLYSKYIYASKI